MTYYKTLTPFENEIYSLLREYIKKTKNFNLEEINEYIHFKLGKNMSQECLKSTVLKFFQEKYFSMGSTLTQDEVNSNVNRREILQFIKINPGAYNRLIRRKLKMGSNEFNWHIQILVKFKLVKVITFGRYAGFFENRSYAGYEYDLFVMQNDKSAKIIDYLLKNPDSNHTKIGKEIHVHYRTLQKHLMELIIQELVIINKYHSPLTYRINEDLVQKIRKIVNGAAIDEIPKDLTPLII